MARKRCMRNVKQHIRSQSSKAKLLRGRRAATLYAAVIYVACKQV